MNTIYNKLRSKRHYHRRPQCANRLKICEYQKCRCWYDIDWRTPKPKVVRAMIVEQ